MRKSIKKDWIILYITMSPMILTILIFSLMLIILKINESPIVPIIGLSGFFITFINVGLIWHRLR